MYWMLSFWFQWSTTIVSWTLTEIKHPHSHPKLPPHTPWLTARILQRLYHSMIKKKQTNSILYHGPVWITLNSFIWNIKTMKHKPSTKSDSYKCRIIRLLKMNRLYWKTTVFFSLWMVKQIHRTDSEMWTWLCHLHAPNPTWQQKEEKKKKKRKEKKRKSRRKWNSDIRLTTARSACGGGCGPGT